VKRGKESRLKPLRLCADLDPSKVSAWETHLTGDTLTFRMPQQRHRNDHHRRSAVHSDAIGSGEAAGGGKVIRRYALMAAHRS